jgi:hypothetical protein
MVYWSYETDGGEYESQSVNSTLKNLFSVVTHFFTRTRWDRLFHLIR